jgi:hypothetical protein
VKKLLLLLILAIVGRSAFAQIEGHVSWAYGSKKIKANEAVVLLKATIDDKWHIYSTGIKTGAATLFKFHPSAAYAPMGKVTEPTPINNYDSNAQMNLAYFKKLVIFQQKIKLKSKKAIVKGSLEYIACNDHKCLPPETVEFSVPMDI